MVYEMNIFSRGINGLANPNLLADFCSQSPTTETQTTAISIQIEEFIIPLGIMIIIGGIVAISIYWRTKRNTRKMRKHYRELSDRFLKEGDCENALLFMKKSLRMAFENDHKFCDGTDLRIIAQIYRSKNNTEMAINYFTEALKLDRRASFKDGMIVDLGNLFLLHMREDDYEKAFDCDIAYLNIVGKRISEL